MATKKPKTTLKKQIQRTKKKTALAVVPKKENQFRPLMIRRYGLAAVLVIAFVVQLGYNFTKTGDVLGRIVNITSAGLLAATNDQRLAAGSPALKINSQLSLAAEQKAQDILSRQYWDHVSPDGIEPWQWIKDSGYTYKSAGENLAKNFSSSGGVVTGWMNSDSHRENMLNPNYTDVGFASVDGKLFGKPATITIAMYAEPAEISFSSGSPFVASAASDDQTKNTALLSPAARIGIAIQSLTPAAMTSVALLLVAATVATTAHAYRKKLPKRLQKSWYKDHGMIKASGLLTIAAFIVLLYGGGQL